MGSTAETDYKPTPGSGIQVMIFGGVGGARTTKNHYRLRTILRQSYKLSIGA